MSTAGDRREKLRAIAEDIENLICSLPLRPLSDDYKSPSQWRQRELYFQCIDTLERNITEKYKFEIYDFGIEVSVRGEGICARGYDIPTALLEWVNEARKWIIFTQGYL